MKLLPVVLLISISVFGQNHFHITGQVDLREGDAFSPNRLGLLTKIQSNDSIKTRTFLIEDNGAFKIDSLSAGRYRLAFRVHDEYGYVDTVLRIETNNLEDLRIIPEKRPCNYDASVDIKNHDVSVLVANVNGLRVNSDSDKRFEKKYRIRYLILSPPFVNLTCLTRYNQNVFNHLDEKFGEKWRKRVRTDAIGFKER